MLLHHNVMANRQTQSGTFAGRFCREKWIEDFLSNFGPNSCAIITNANLDFVAKVLRFNYERWLEAGVENFTPSLGRGVKPIGDQVEENTRDILRIDIDLSSVLIKFTLQGDIEVGTLGPRAVVCQIERFVDHGID